MSLVILQPAGTDQSDFNFNSTMKNPVELDRIVKYEKSIEKSLRLVYKSGKVPTWGVTPAKNKTNITKWQKVNRGDVVFFYADQKYFASAVVTGKVHSKELAIDLWKWKDKEKTITWEYIYFLDEVKYIDIPILDMNSLINYKTDKLQGFTVLSQKQSDSILNVYEYISEIHNTPVSNEGYKKAVGALKPGQPLDAETKAYARTEQSFLRGNLFGFSMTGTCGICGQELPVNLLVAAHIKKRADCSYEERVDADNIVMPMCKFGCDDLYEKGYITVKNGKVLAESKLILTNYVKEHLQRIQGRECTHWREETKAYFTWHNHKHGFSDL